MELILNEKPYETYIENNKYVLKEKLELPSFFNFVLHENGIVKEVKKHAYIKSQEQYEDKYYIDFGEISEQEYEMQEQKAKIEYIAMMADIDLEPTEEGDSDEQEIPVSEEVL